MENNILKEIVINSKATLKLSHLGLKWGMYSFLVPLVLVVLLPAVFLPVIGWIFYSLTVFMIYSNARSARLLYKVRDYRFQKIFIIKDDGEVVQKDYYYALTDKVNILCIMEIADIAKNESLKALLTAQYNKKNNLYSIDLTQGEFLEYHKEGRLSNGF